MKALAIALVAGGLLATAAPVPVLAQEVTVQQFMTRIDRLPPGPLALLSPDSGRLKRGSSRAHSPPCSPSSSRRDRRGRRPATCIPDRFNMNSDEAFAYFNAIPRARRERMTVTEGARLWMTHKFPCS